MLSIPQVADEPSLISCADRRGLFQATVSLPLTTSRVLAALSRDEDVSLFVVLAASYYVLLARSTGHVNILLDAIDLCMPAATRPCPPLASIRNMQLSFQAGTPFRQVLRSAARMVQRLDLERPEPATQASVVDHNAAAPADLPRELHSLLVLREAVQDHLPKSPALVTSLPGATIGIGIVSGVDGELSCTLWSGTQRFDSDALKRMAAQYAALLASIAARPGQPTGALSLFDQAERQRLLTQWNATQRSYPYAQTIHELFELQAHATPDRPALICEDKVQTIGELNLRANRLTHRLMRLGIGPGDLVATLTERSMESIAALLAIFKAGAVYLPLDPAYPAERIGFVLNDARPALLLGQRDLIDRLPAVPVPIHYLDHAIDDHHDTGNNPPVRTNADSLAYVIYTSGSTGTPKGVAIQMRQLINRFAWFWELFPFAPDTVGCQKTSMGFVDSLWECFGYLLKGYPTVLIAQHQLLDPGLFINALARHKVTHVWLVPSLLKMLLREAELARKLPALRFVSPGGEPLTQDVADLFRKSLPDAVVLNLYGLSETWDATFALYEPADREWQVSIGKPIANVRVHVLDAYLEPAPIGVPGEIHVAGDGLARGYINRPDLDAQCFLPEPASVPNAGRMYRTGDLGRRLPDGNIEYLGRIDQQVKIRGYRIEPGEIETALERLEEIELAAVGFRELEGQASALVAYVVPRPGRSLDAGGVRQSLRRILPEYMVPFIYVALDRMPLTASGKIDRQSLRSRPLGAASARTSTAPPCTADDAQTTAYLTAMLARIAQLELTPQDNFFEHGVDSLALMVLQSELSEALAVELMISDFLENPTIEGLVSLIRERRTTSVSP